MRVGSLSTPREVLRRSLLCRSLVTGSPELDPSVPSPDRTLTAVVRDEKKMGTNHSRTLRKSGRVPAAVIGDRLPFVHVSVDRKELMPFLKRTHFQRELLTVSVEGGETVKALVQEVRCSHRRRRRPTRCSPCGAQPAVHTTQHPAVKYFVTAAVAAAAADATADAAAAAAAALRRTGAI